MNQNFIIGLILSIVFGAAMEQLYRNAPGVAVFVAATLGAQVYAHMISDRKRVRIEMTPKKISKFAKEMQMFKK